LGIITPSALHFVVQRGGRPDIDPAQHRLLIHTRMESTAHASLMPDGKARQFNFVMEAKSVITFPSGGQQLPGPGFYEIRGLAWSGGL
jgi:hypothetical protein